MVTHFPTGVLIESIDQVLTTVNEFAANVQGRMPILG